MGILVYGPDTFTVGVDQTLQAYNTDWKNVSDGGDSLQVVAATDDLRDTTGGGGNAAAYWGKSMFPNHKIVADIGIGVDAGTFVGLKARASSLNTGYVAYWQPGGGGIRLDVLAGESKPGIGFTLATAGTVAINTAYPGAYLKVTGTNPTLIEVGDNINGAAIIYRAGEFFDLVSNFTFPEYMQGYPGLSIFSFTASTDKFDNVSIYDETNYPVFRQRIPVTMLDSQDDGRWPELKGREWF